MAVGLTTAQVMQRLNVRDPDTVYSLRTAGKIRGGRLGRQWRWDEESVDRLIRGEPAAPSRPQPPAAPRPPACPDFLGERRRRRSALVHG